MAKESREPKTELTKEDKDRVIVKLNDLWLGPKNCPISGHNNWAVSDHVVHPPVWYAGAMTLGGPTYPHVMLTCRECGYSMFFNALILGVLEASPGEESEKVSSDAVAESD